MGVGLSHCRLFFQEFRQNFRTTGAVLPSGRRLARALARFVRQRDGTGPRRILEVGPGTGAVTREIIAAMGPEDRLDLVELNDRFVACLGERFKSDPFFASVADRSRVLHCPVEHLPPDGSYGVIVSGLPLNNFGVNEVRRILDALKLLAAAGGTLSFFEYVALRRLKGMLSGPAERGRLRGIGRVLGDLLKSRQVQRDGIWANVPPAWVHHVRF
ncbi:MAG: methyltransferase domain-containing protein [Thermoguttaceae bacterium]|jgi:phospholipid N-methyltransferase